MGGWLWMHTSPLGKLSDPAIEFKTVGHTFYESSTPVTGWLYGKKTSWVNRETQWLGSKTIVKIHMRESIRKLCQICWYKPMFCVIHEFSDSPFFHSDLMQLTSLRAVPEGIATCQNIVQRVFIEAKKATTARQYAETLTCLINQPRWLDLKWTDPVLGPTFRLTLKQTGRVRKFA